MKAQYIARWFKVRGNPKIETLLVIGKEHRQYFGSENKSAKKVEDLQRACQNSSCIVKSRSGS